MYRYSNAIRLPGLGIIALTLLVSVFISPAQPVLAATINVTVTNTTDAINASDGCSLREAIALGNSATSLTNDCGTTTGSSDTVAIDFNIDGSGPHYITITGASGDDNNASGDFDIKRPMSINNTSGEQIFVQGCAAQTTPSCTGVDRIFHVQSTVGLTANAVRISNINIRNGSIGNGDGIYVQGSVTVDSVTISNSGTAGGNGGGMLIQPGQNATVTVINSTFSGNRSYRGAAVYANTANVTITFTNTTFYGHTVSAGGWVVNADNGTLVLQNSVIAASSAGTNCSGAGISGTNNFTENCSFTGGSNNNSTTALDANDISASLASNGGPTLTHAIPLGTSDLVNAGSDALITATTDQRGYTRKVSTVDVGSYEFGATAPDTTKPTVTINQEANQDDPTEDSPINFTVVFSEPVADFATGDVTLSGTAGATTGTVTETAPNDGTTYNVAVSGMTSPGTVIASIAAGVAQDAAGNTNEASTSTDNEVEFEDPDPTVTINQASAQSDPTNATPINFTVVFSEPVTGFTDADVTLGGTAGATTAVVTETSPNDGTTYNVAVSGMTTDGTVTASIPADAATGSLSGGNEASTSTDNTVTYDTTDPGVTVEQASGQDDPALVAPINFTVTFSEPVTGFTDADVTLGGTAGATTANVTEISPNDGTTYNVAVSGMTTSGTVTASLAAGVAEDAAENQNTASTSTDNEVTFAPVVPVVTGIVRASANPTTAASVDYTVTFSEDVTGVDATDFTVTTSGLSGVSVTNVTGSDASYTVTVSTGTGNNGTLQLNLVDDDTILDSDSNALGGTGAANGNYSGEIYSVRPVTPPSDPPRTNTGSAAPAPAPASVQNFLCANLGAVTSNAMQAGPGNAIRDGIFGDLYCSIFALDGVLLNAPGIGNQSVLDQSVVQAVDVYGLLPGGVSTDAFTAPVRFCLRGTGSILFIHFDPVAMTNVVSSLSGVASPAGYTCADIPAAGVVVLVGTLSAVAPASLPVDGPTTASAVCVPSTLTTTHRINLRAEASINSADIGDVPYNVTLQVTDAAPGWYKVIFLDGQGWVSADYVTTQGC